MTANQALNELDKFPTFRAELAELLELGRELSRTEDFAEIGTLSGKLIGKAARLGSMMSLRDALDRAAQLKALQS